MPIFVCDSCGCKENTALGAYWARNMEDCWDPEWVGKALCSECGPPKFKDGSSTGYGKWHGRFTKTQATPEEIESGYFINRRKPTAD